MGPASDKEVDDKHDECDSDASRHDAELGHCHGDDDDDEGYYPGGDDADDDSSDGVMVVVMVMRMAVISLAMVTMLWVPILMTVIP